MAAPSNAAEGHLIQVCTKTKTGLVFDDRMTEHHCPWDEKFIECPDRYTSSLQRCRDYGLVERCFILQSRSATEEELQLVHDKKHVENIKSSKTLTNDKHLEELASFYDSVYFNAKTYDSALLSAGSTLELVASVLKGEVSNGLALVRPPGHHAMAKEANGFCYFNNVAIAAKYALKNFKLKKILIIDWDVHHGQATQRIFYDDPRVLYFSIHRYEDGKFWPHLRESNFDFAGSGAGKGFNINVPLNAIGQGNAEYLAIFNNVLLPAAYEFSPELVLISAGYDAALGCPEGEMKVTPMAYPHLLNSVMPLAKGRTCVVLEGGYCIRSLSESVALTLRALLKDPCPVIPACLDVNKVTVDSILNAISVHRDNWDALKLQTTYDSSIDAMDTEGFGEEKHVAVINYAGNPLEGVSVYDTRGYYPAQQPHVVEAYAEQIDGLISKNNLHVPDYCTGLTFDFMMKSPDPDVSHNMNEVLGKFKQGGLLAKCVLLEPANPLKVATIDNLPRMKPSPDLLKALSVLKGEFDCVRHSQKASQCDALGSLLQLVNAVADGSIQNGLALIPPNWDKPCVFDSIQAATRYLLLQHKMHRILILDWNTNSDGHTQRIFHGDSGVLYISLQSGNEKDVGIGPGKGYNFNIPFNPQTADGDYMAAFFQLILPVAYEFSPQFVIVSSGFGAPSNNSLGSRVSHGIMVRLLSSLCNGKVVLACEGGPSPELGDSLFQCLSALVGESCIEFQSMKPTSEGVRVICDVRRIQKNYWKCLKFDKMLPEMVMPILSDGIDSNRMQARGFLKRRQSSDPVAIPKSDRSGSCMAPDCEVPDNFVNPMEFFCVTPLEYCPHLELLQPLPKEGLNLKAPCLVCNDSNENWVCLHCYQVYCGRFVNQHMMQHGTDMGHYLTLSYSDLSVWCYACDAYIHNAALGEIKDHACDKKFN